MCARVATLLRATQLSIAATWMRAWETNARPKMKSRKSGRSTPPVTRLNAPGCYPAEGLLSCLDIMKEYGEILSELADPLSKMGNSTLTMATAHGHHGRAEAPRTRRN